MPLPSVAGRTHPKPAVVSFPEMLRQRILVAGCVAALLSADLGCRQAAAPAPLKEDPVLAQELLKQKQRFESSRLPVLSADGAKQLEAALARNPEDLKAREHLLFFYSWNGKNPLP